MRLSTLRTVCLAVAALAGLSGCGDSSRRDLDKANTNARPSGVMKDQDRIGTTPDGAAEKGGSLPGVPGMPGMPGARRNR
jgi:hypothetical protein